MYLEKLRFYLEKASVVSLYNIIIQSLIQSLTVLTVFPTNPAVRSELLLLKKVAPSCSDKVPGQRHPHNVSGDILDGRGGVLFADLSWV